MNIFTPLVSNPLYWQYCAFLKAQNCLKALKFLIHVNTEYVINECYSSYFGSLTNLHATVWAWTIIIWSTHTYGHDLPCCCFFHPDAERTHGDCPSLVVVEASGIHLFTPTGTEHSHTNKAEDASILLIELQIKYYYSVLYMEKAEGFQASSQIYKPWVRSMEILESYCGKDRLDYKLITSPPAPFLRSFEEKWRLNTKEQWKSSNGARQEHEPQITTGSPDNGCDYVESNNNYCVPMAQW